jgi:hypothetical protein
LTNKNFPKPIDKSVPVWYNIVRKRGEKPQEREVTNMTKTITHFQCTVYLADGKHISQNEICATSAEALERAKAWTTLGHKAVAHRVVVNYSVGEVYYYPLA